MVSRQEYDPALKLLAKLGGPIDNFFDRVLVMTADRELKSNRMAILNNIVNLFRKLADFSKVVTE
jgi:glycyl-tRNA synthetase beta chain